LSIRDPGRKTTALILAIGRREVNMEQQKVGIWYELRISAETLS